MTDRAVGWIRARSLAEWMALGAALAVFGYVGWDGALWDARLQLLLHLLAVGAIAGLAVIGLRGGALPRTALDLPLLALIAAFALATLSALNLGMSLRATAVIVATAAMLPVALIAIRHHPSWVGIVTAVPVLLLSIPTLVVLVVRRAEWVLVGAPGLPPIRLPSEGTPFGSVAVPPFVIWPAWALAGLIESPPWRRAVRTGLVIVGAPLTILSGSRSAWLAIAATLLLAAVPWAWHRRHRLRLRRALEPRTILVGLAAVGGLALVAVLIAPRVTAVTSLVYRASLWRDTINAWATDPLLGIGPGFMPFARQAAAPDFSFPVRQPHSHNLPLGVLGDAGILGLVAAIVLVAVIAWVAGPWRSRTPAGRACALVLAGLAIGGLFEDLTFLPNFNLLAVALLAVSLTDAGAVTWRVPARSRVSAVRVVPAALAAVALLAAMVVADAGAIAYRGGVDAAARGDWSVATARFARAGEIDRWHPSSPKALAVAADADGRTQLAREAARTATELNPGDGPSWVNLAVLCASLDDADCQAHATGRAAARAEFFGAELVNAAFSYESLGRPDEADEAYRRSLLSQRLTIFATDWPRRIPIGDDGLEDVAGAVVELNRLLAWWEMEEPIDPSRIADPAVRALAHALRGERAEAEPDVAAAIAAHPEQPMTWDVAIILRHHWGQPIERDLAIAGVVRGSPFPPPTATSQPPGLTFDIGSFRAYPRDELVSDAVRLRSEPVYPWALEPLLP